MNNRLDLTYPLTFFSLLSGALIFIYKIILKMFFVSVPEFSLPFDFAIIRSLALIIFLVIILYWTVSLFLLFLNLLVHLLGNKKIEKFYLNIITIFFNGKRKDVFLLSVLFMAIPTLLLSFLLSTRDYLVFLVFLFLVMVYSVFENRITSKYNIKKGFFIILASLGVLYFIIVVFSFVCYFNSSFEIQYDKEMYFEGEDVFLKIYPLGIFRPEILEVHYSNELLLLENRTDKSYRAAPLYLKIDSNHLKNTSYNSYILVKYRYLKGSQFLKLREAYFVSFVPVFNETRPNN